MHNNKIQEVLQRYTYNPSAAKQIAIGITSYKGIKQDTLTPVTIKIIDSLSNALYQYFKKLTAVKSDYVSKIYELVKTQFKLMVIFQDNTFGTLGMAMAKCKRLEDSDFIHISRMILNAQVDLLRSGVSWIGDQNDIQIGENGMKLSWNGAPISTNYKNPLPQILKRLSYRQNSIGLLPFPKNKQIQEVIELASENATVISSHDIIKKRDKIFKKKGKGWLAIRQSKNKNEYYEEVIYLAVSLTNGFVRVKYYESGRVQKGMLQLNKQKSSFTKIIDNYEDSGNIVYVSEYSNDGNVLQYITKLKNAGVTLNEDQIEFFFYSLIDPIKQIQGSPLQSLNLLHIRNIFIEFGIPKIGEPIPISNNFDKMLQQRSQVPDFYHPKFKSAPLTHNPSYDTYSLGILLYKLMYTEYPIFPQKKVHIPTTPSYKQRTVATVQLFLNEGGRIADIEQRIQVSEAVKKQIQQNRKKKLEQNRKNMIKTQRIGGESSFFNGQQIQSEKKSNFQQQNQFQLNIKNNNLNLNEKIKFKNIKKRDQYKQNTMIKTHQIGKQSFFKSEHLKVDNQNYKIQNQYQQNSQSKIHEQNIQASIPINQQLIKNTLKQFKQNHIHERSFDDSIINRESNVNIWNYLFQPVVQDKSQKVLHGFFIESEYSSRSNYRISINLIIIVCIYILVFYMFYLKNLFNLFISSTGYHSLTIQVNAVNYAINVVDDNKFFQQYKNTILNDLQGSSQSLNCAINNSSNNFTNYVNGLSPGWIIYLIFSLLFFISFIILKVSQGTTYDFVTAVSKYQLKRRSFNISRYIILNITFGLALYSHYFMFNYIFHAQYDPCFGGNQSQWYSSTYRLFYDRSSLAAIIVPTMLGILLYYLAMIQFSFSKNIKRYNRIFNPITLFVPAYIALTIIMRLGVLNDFKPSWLNSSIIKQQFIKGNYIAIFGIVPQILIVAEHAITLLIDFIFWRIQKSKKIEINDNISEQVRN